MIDETHINRASQLLQYMEPCDVMENLDGTDFLFLAVVAAEILNVDREKAVLEKMKDGTNSK